MRARGRDALLQNLAEASVIELDEALELGELAVVRLQPHLESDAGVARVARVGRPDARARVRCVRAPALAHRALGALERRRELVEAAVLAGVRRLDGAVERDELALGDWPVDRALARTAQRAPAAARLARHGPDAARAHRPRSAPAHCGARLVAAVVVIVQTGAVAAERLIVRVVEKDAVELDALGVLERELEVREELALLVGIKVRDARELLVEQADEELVRCRAVRLMQQGARLEVAVRRVVGVRLDGDVVDAVALEAVDGRLELLVAAYAADQRVSPLCWRKHGTDAM
jgi:hypothetical protein